MRIRNCVKHTIWLIYLKMHTVTICIIHDSYKQLHQVLVVTRWVCLIAIFLISFRETLHLYLHTLKYLTLGTSFPYLKFSSQLILVLHSRVEFWSSLTCFKGDHVSAGCTIYRLHCMWSLKSHLSMELETCHSHLKSWVLYMSVWWADNIIFIKRFNIALAAT